MDRSTIKLEFQVTRRGIRVTDGAGKVRDLSSRFRLIIWTGTWPTAFGFVDFGESARREELTLPAVVAPEDQLALAASIAAEGPSGLPHTMVREDPRLDQLDLYGG